MYIQALKLLPHEVFRLALAIKSEDLRRNQNWPATSSSICSTDWGLFCASTSLLQAPRSRTLWYLDLAVMVPKWGCVLLSFKFRSKASVKSLQSYYPFTSSSRHRTECFSSFVVHTKPLIHHTFLENSTILRQRVASRNFVHYIRSRCWKSPLL